MSNLVSFRYFKTSPEIIQLAKVTLKTKYIQTKPWRRSHRVALFSDLIEYGGQMNTDALAR